MPATEVQVSKRFADWIDERRPAYIAGALGVSVAAVYFWRNGTTRPSPDRLAGLLALAGGRLTASDIYPPKERTDP